MENPGLVTSRLTKGLVERDVTKGILKEVKKLEAGTESIVARLPILHMPSSGATTIARNVLWRLKEKRKCVIIDGNHYRDDLIKLEEVADSLLQSRALGENDDTVLQGTHSDLTCPTVIVLFDNCNQLMAKALTRYVVQKCEKKGIVSKTPILVMMCLYSTFKYQPDNVDHFDVESKKFPRIDRHLSPKEKERFSDKLHEIKKERRTVEDLLSFVILAYANEEDSEFVRNVVNKTLADMKNREKCLLSYLAILKYYSNGWLPNQLLINFNYGQNIPGVDTTGCEAGAAHRQILSEQFLSLVTMDDSMPNYTGGGSFWPRKNFVYVSHSSVAYNILKELVPGNTLATTVKDMLSEKAIMGTDLQRDHVQKVFRLLLTQRTIDEETHIKSQRSKVIDAVIKSENKERAVEVLKCAYSVMDDGFNKAHIAQTIARIYRELDGQWGSAKTWAVNAVQQAPNNFAIRDTLGRVYLSKQLDTIRSKGINYYVDEHPGVLNAWYKALTEFRTAQKDFYSYRKHNGQKKRFSNVVDEDVNHDENDSGVAINTPSGIVEANIKLMEFLLGTEDLAKNSDNREVFLDILIKADGSRDFSSLFSKGSETTDFSWEPYHADILDIFKTTRECLDLLTRKLCYMDTKPKVSSTGTAATSIVGKGAITDSSPITPTAQSQSSAVTKEWMETVDKQAKSFRKIFGYKENAGDHNSFESPDITLRGKLETARRILQTSLATSFGWLSRRETTAWAEESKLKEYCKCLRKMIEASSNLKSPLIILDKLCYVNVAFAYHLSNLRGNGTRGNVQDQGPILDYQRVEKYVVDLVASKVDSPDPYFFFTMIFFPNVEIRHRDKLAELGSLSEEERKYFIRCVNQLRDFWQKDFYWVKPRYVFYLGPGDNQSMDRFLPGMGSGVEAPPAKRLKLSGVLDDKMDVLVNLGDNEKLKIKNMKPYQRNKPLSTQNVTFNLAFTYGGPVAVDVVSV